jgi:tetratricopeptide (TPR) repeat protein
LALAGRPEESEWLWRAGACAMRGQIFKSAIAVYERFVALRPLLPQLSEACYRLGEAHQALHEDGPAEASYQNCIQTDGPFKYRARYQLALAEIRRANLVDAEQMLEHNLKLLVAEAELDRDAHEKTLYALADVLFQRSDFHMAADRWEQALRLYPVSSGASDARYRLALCYRRLLERESQGAQPVATSDTRSRYGRRFLWLESAQAHFRKLVEDLQAQQAAGPLTEADATLLRKGRFALADCYFDQGHYSAAVPLYIGLANQHPQRIDSLVALQQLYRSYVELMAQPKPEASLDLVLHALKDMREVLKQLDEKPLGSGPEMEKRRELERWLKDEEERLRMLGLDKPPG